MNCLQADRFIKLKKGEPTTAIDDTIHDMQKWLFNNCNTEKTKIANEYELSDNWLNDGV